MVHAERRILRDRDFYLQKSLLNQVGEDVQAVPLVYRLRQGHLPLEGPKPYILPGFVAFLNRLHILRPQLGGCDELHGAAVLNQPQYSVGDFNETRGGEKSYRPPVNLCHRQDIVVEFSGEGRNVPRPVADLEAYVGESCGHRYCTPFFKDSSRPSKVFFTLE